MKFSPIIPIFVIGWCGIQGACAQPTEPSGNPPWQPIGKYTHVPIRESSGVVASHQFEGVYWTLNDSGNPAVLYATTLEGKSIGEFTVQGATDRDWEVLALDGSLKYVSQPTP